MITRIVRGTIDVCLLGIAITLKAKRLAHKHRSRRNKRDVAGTPLFFLAPALTTQLGLIGKSPGAAFEAPANRVGMPYTEGGQDRHLQPIAAPHRVPLAQNCKEAGSSTETPVGADSQRTVVGEASENEVRPPLLPHATLPFQCARFVKHAAAWQRLLKILHAFAGHLCITQHYGFQGLQFS